MDTAQITNASMQRAVCWISEAAWVIGDAGLPWLPFEVMTNGGSGSAMFYWWNREATRGLSVYVFADNIEYVQQWGPDDTTERVEGTLRDGKEFLPIWSWLCGKADNPSRQPYPGTLTSEQRDMLIRSMIASQRLAGLDVSREDAERAVDEALTMPLPEIG